MKLGRGLLGLAAVLLLATALFHGSGGSMVSSWLTGQRGEMLQALWYLPSLDWLVVALVWAFVAARPSGPAATLALILALLPAGAALLVSGAVGWGFPGVWMLAGAAVLGAAGSAKLRNAQR
ncbi:hypothetical protein [Sphingomonas sp.]|uniref:hypothetical protein n=1 Tax=Sphingomonas sp. TaxID=28214 RepID=UPI002DE7E7E1|nr:hypothetical protein [Sphingomonas sp.]